MVFLVDFDISAKLHRPHPTIMLVTIWLGKYTYNTYVSSKPSGLKIGSHPKSFGPEAGTIAPYTGHTKPTTHSLLSPLYWA